MMMSVISGPFADRPSCASPPLRRLSCDKTVIGLMKERTLGNSASRLRAALVEQHTRDWMRRSMKYLSVLRKLRVPGVEQPRQVSLPPMHPVPSVSWLLSVYVREALTRLDETKARVTSVFGDILKLDSTKKASFEYIVKRALFSVLCDAIRCDVTWLFSS